MSAHSGLVLGVGVYRWAGSRTLALVGMSVWGEDGLGAGTRYEWYCFSSPFYLLVSFDTRVLTGSICKRILVLGCCWNKSKRQNSHIIMIIVPLLYIYM